MRFIFVHVQAYENILTPKISRITVHVYSIRICSLAVDYVISLEDDCKGECVARHSTGQVTVTCLFPTLVVLIFNLLSFILQGTAWHHAKVQ